MPGRKTDTKPETIRVWDAFIRVFHWALVGAIAVAGWTGFLAGAAAINIHIWAGAMATALVVMRLIWGVLGGGFARFAQFVTGPRTVLAHLRTEHRHLGHNPLGGWMVLTLIAVVGVLAVTGVVVLGGVYHAGPMRALATVKTGFALRELHEILAFALLGLVVLHVGGVIFESRRSRENLARAMVTGRKPARPGDPPLPGARAHPLIATALGVGGMALVVLIALPMARQPVPGAPVDMAGSAYATDCAECHIAWHPSLLPAESWKQILSGLEDYFGEDASLSAARVAELTVWLTAHAAENTDTKPARLFARVNAEHPLEITETRAWERIHDDLPEALFKSPPVYSRGNCAACHQDAASGWFYPGDISLPQRAAETSESKGDQ